MTPPNENQGPPAGGEALVASGATLMQVTSREMRAVSMQHPRDFDKVLTSVIAEVNRVPEWAVRGFYVKPVGDGNSATGSSVYLTRILARQFRNCSVRSYIANQTEELIEVSGVFIDLEANYLVEAMQPVSPYAWRRADKGYVKLVGEKLMNLVLIGASKAERNAIAKAVPDWLLQTAFDRCRFLAADETKKTLSTVVTWFMGQGVTREALERHFGGRSLDKLDEEQLAEFRGLANAVRDAEVDPRTIGKAAEKTDEPEASAANVDEILAQGATVVSGAQAQPAEPSEPAEPVDPLAEGVQQELIEPTTPSGADVVQLRPAGATESPANPEPTQDEESW